jgi:hypothetical protein
VQDARAAEARDADAAPVVPVQDEHRHPAQPLAGPAGDRDLRDLVEPDGQLTVATVQLEPVGADVEAAGAGRAAVAPHHGVATGHQWLIVPATCPTSSRPTWPMFTLAKLCETKG